METKMIITGMLVVAGLGAIGIFWYSAHKWYQEHPCIKSHQETYHHDAHTSIWLMQSGEITIPMSQYHPAYDSVKTICDERK